MSRLESNKPLLAASIGYLRENTEIPQTDTARAVSSPESDMFKIFHGSWGAMWRDTVLSSVFLIQLSTDCQSTIIPYSPKFWLCFFPLFTSWVALLYKLLYSFWTWASLEVFTWPPAALNNHLAFFTQASYFAVRFCSLNLNIFSGPSMHDLVVWQGACAKKWKTKGRKLLDMEDPWNWSDLVNRSSWINLKAYCHQRWKVSHNWLSLSLCHTLYHLDLVKQ